MKILFVASEFAPWVKTGGLGDVAQGLPQALNELGHDVRVLLPAYESIFDQSIKTKKEPKFRAPIEGVECQLLSAKYRDIKIFLLDAPLYREIQGNPYHNEWGEVHPNSINRFNLLCKIAAALAGRRVGLNWQPDLVHCNDWQTGLTPVWMLLTRVNIPSLFTIHNLHYQGLFPAQMMETLKLPWWLLHADALEYYGELSFIKGGLVFADQLNTVSPTYAREICTDACGQGLQGILSHRASDLCGILNGIDDQIWDPNSDPHLHAQYSVSDLSGKALCKQALQTHLGLKPDANMPLLGLVARLVPQKGVDLLLACLNDVLAMGVQIAILGSGEAYLERQLQYLADMYRSQLAVHIGFNEALAHQIEAGADIFLMPSRFEPSGLNQMYSMRYGTVPIVAPCGGLLDSVTHTTPTTLRNKQATGFVMGAPTSDALHQSIGYALDLFKQTKTWQQLMRQTMSQNFSWRQVAKNYEKLYEKTIQSTAYR